MLLCSAAWRATGSNKFHVWHNRRHSCNLANTAHRHAADPHAGIDAHPVVSPNNGTNTVLWESHIGG